MNDVRGEEDPEGPFFLIALFDEQDPAATTVHTLTDPAIWAWLYAPVPFQDGSDVVAVPIPGTGLVAHVTCYEPLIDKAQHLVSLPGTRGRSHPALTVRHLGSSDTVAFRDAYAGLRAAAGTARMFEGRW